MHIYKFTYREWIFDDMGPPFLSDNEDTAIISFNDCPDNLLDAWDTFVALYRKKHWQHSRIEAIKVERLGVVTWQD